jgi:hypothetical protein
VKPLGLLALLEFAELTSTALDCNGQKSNLTKLRATCTRNGGSLSDDCSER